jgi:DmsE family decaheme c-type cytochrome
MRHRLYMLAILVWLSGWGETAFAQTAGAPQAQAAASSQKTDVKPADYIGAESCATCHQAEVKGFDNNPHTRLALEHGGKGVTCEGCHGPGKAHVESGGDASKIFQFTKATPKQVDQKCLSCHIAAHPDFERTAHGQALISCTNCHSSHKFEPQTKMLKAEQPALCNQCHTDIHASFEQPFHHRVPEGLMKCSDCHDPHGTFQPKMVKLNSTQDSICTKCHLDKLGPYLYEHPSVKTEGCTACHSPHGSPNSRLLWRSNINTVCLQCHTSTMNFNTSPAFGGAPGTPSFHNVANQYVSCTTCHTQIHGSNASPFFFK